MDQSVRVPQKPINCNQPPKPREKLTVVTHNHIDLSVWEPQLLIGFFPSRTTRDIGICNWESLTTAARGLTLWNACLVDFLLEYPETVQYYRPQYAGMIFVFAGTIYDQVGYGTHGGRVMRRRGRRALRGLKIAESGAWEEVVVATAHPFVRDRHVLAVAP